MKLKSERSDNEFLEEAWTADLTAVVTRREGVMSCKVAEETVLLDMNSGVYFGLNPIGTSIWSTLSSPRSIAEIRDTLLKEYDVEPSACVAAIWRFTKGMAAKGLVTVVQE